jgi:FTR1 family protein
MLATFVLGLREGLEAALIVGIVAAFLRQRGRLDLLRWVLAGVGSAVLLCAAAGVALQVLSRDLPQRQQEGLETVIAAVAVGMVTYMVVWMRRHSRQLKGQLESAAAGALATGSATALVAMAFLAVLREGFETAVFLLAAFQQNGNVQNADGGPAGLGAVLGIAVAAALGYGIYRGGVRLNLSRFFRITGVLLVLVAAGLVVGALHSAHEACWLNIGQRSTLDLSGLVAPGSIRAALLTGMLGLQPRPVLIELLGWLLYLVPLGLYVGWPAGRRTGRPVLIGATLAGTAAIVAVALAVPAVFSDREPAAAERPTGPAAAGSSDPHIAKVTITARQCLLDRPEYAAGGITFAVSNTDATGVSEVEVLDGQRILAEKENLPPGFSGSFSVTLAAGSYTLYCPGAQTEKVALTVTGASTVAPSGNTHALLVRGSQHYAAFVEQQAGLLVDQVRTLVAAINSGDLATAQAHYAAARPYYERIEPVAESFQDLDPAIDARADDLPISRLTGFHRIEYGLFQLRSLAGLGPIGDRLLADCSKLQALTRGLSYQPAQLANGAVELLDEVSRSKVTGEEERYSHLDLLDLQANVEGARQAFDDLRPGLTVIDPELAGRLRDGFTAVLSQLGRYREPHQPSGFVPYPTLSEPAVTALAQAVQAVAEPLSQVAGKVVNA